MVVLRGDLIKCVVIGDDEVGKTSMLLNYATNRFPAQRVPELFDNFAGCVKLSGKQYTLQMIDTLSEGEGHEMRRLSYTGADVFVVCFNVVKPETLHNVQRRWIPEVKNLMGETPFIIMGTHTDLRDDETIVEELRRNGQRPVSSREAAALSRRLGAACYLEFSPIMKKRMKRIMNEAFASVFCRKDNTVDTGCVIS